MKGGLEISLMDVWDGALIAVLGGAAEMVIAAVAAC